jgi:PTS hybrid protein
MVGIVLVSHSRRLADGLAELLAQLGGGDVPVAVAAGTADGRIGTDPDAVRTAITTADQGDGVLIIPDLGSAVLAVRLALDDFPQAALADAPFVEGAVAATVTASTGADLQTVLAAATEARTIPKF